MKLTQRQLYDLFHSAAAVSVTYRGGTYIHSLVSFNVAKDFLVIPITDLGKELTFTVFEEMHASLTRSGEISALDSLGRPYLLTLLNPVPANHLETL